MRPTGNHQPRLRLIKGGRKTKPVPVIIDGKPVRTLLFSWPGGKLRKGAS
jgi:hypothetical protein